MISTSVKTFFLSRCDLPGKDMRQNDHFKVVHVGQTLGEFIVMCSFWIFTPPRDWVVKVTPTSGTHSLKVVLEYINVTKRLYFFLPKFSVEETHQNPKTLKKKKSSTPE